jgi:hypothetical protein
MDILFLCGYLKEKIMLFPVSNSRDIEMATA